MNSIELKEKRKELRLTQSDLAEKLGVSLRTIINYEQGGVIPKSKSALLRTVFYDLENEKSEKQVNEYEESNVIPIKVNEPKEQIANKNGNVYEELGDGKYKIFVKKVPVKAFGSYLSHYQDSEFFDELKHVSFTVDHVGRGKYICFEVMGNSMNGGRIDDSKDGAELLCRELGRQHWKDGFRQSPLGWVIVHKDTILFKDIKSVDMSTGDAVLSSRSGLPQHPDFTINLNDVRQIWKVITRTQS